MRVINGNEATAEKRLINWKAYREAIEASRKRSGRKTETEIISEKHMELFIKKIVAPQLKEGWVLDLSDNEAIGKKLGLTTTQARRAKENLSKRGVLFVPPEKKQKKKGDYPIWLIKVELVKTTVVNVETKKKRVIRPVEQRYNKFYCEKIYYPVLNEIKEMFEYEEQETGEEVVLSSQQYWIIANTWINDELERRGMTRDDCRI